MPARIPLFNLPTQSGFSGTDYLVTSRSNRVGKTLGSGIFGTMLGFTQAGTGAAARTAQSKMREVVSVTDFGAVGDGVTNDAAAIQAAQNYIETFAGSSVGAAALYFPSPRTVNGFYLVNSKITVGKVCRWFGDEMVGTQIKTTGNGITVLEVKNLTAPLSDPIEHFVMQDLFIKGSGAASTAPVVIFENVHRATLDRVAIFGGDVGWQLKGGSAGGAQSSFTNTARNCRFDACNSIAVDAQKSTALLVLDACQVGGTPIGVKVLDATDFRALNCDIESCSTAGIDIDEAATTVSALNVGAVLIGNHFEGNTGRDIRLGNTQVVNGITIIGNMFGSTAATKPVDAVRVAGLALVGNTAYNWTTSSLVTLGTVTGFSEIDTIYGIAGLAAHAAAKIGLPTYDGRAQGRSTANQDFASATPANVTGHSFAIAATEEWQAEFDLNVGAGLGTTGIIIAVNGPVGATIDVAVSIVPQVVATTGTYFQQSQTLNGNVDFTAASQPGGTNASVRVSVWILAGATAGTVQLKCANSAASSTLTIRKGSHMFANRLA